MKKFKLIVRAPNYQWGHVLFFYSRELAIFEKRKWENQGYICVIEEV